jgi:PAS domain S-box-containing protein
MFTNQHTDAAPGLALFDSRGGRRDAPADDVNVTETLPSAHQQRHDSEFLIGERSEDALRNLNAELEQRVEERTRALAAAHESVARSEANFRRVTESAPDGMLVHRWGSISYANPAFLRALGYQSLGEVVGRSLLDLIHPRDRSKLLSQLESLRACEHAVDPVQVRFLRVDEQLRWMDVTGTHVLYDSEPVAMLLARDVTEQHRAEALRRANEARFRRLFHDSPIALWEQDFSEVREHLEGLRTAGICDLPRYLESHPAALELCMQKVRLVEVNEAALSLYEALGQSDLALGLPRLFDDTARALLLAELNFLLSAQGSSFATQTSARTLRGRRIDIDLRFTLLPGCEESWSRIVVSIFDLTPHKQAEHQIRSSLREKEVLLKEIHHRVKNNLQVISSLLNLQAHHVADPSLGQMFAESQSRILSIALVHEKLYQSKDLSHVDFAEYVRSLSAQLLHANDAKQRQITCELDVHEVRLPVDRAIPCGLILNELITNALRHAFPGGRSGRVWITLKQVNTRELELSVEDDGVGFPPGFDVRKAATLGLELVFTFAEQLDAQVTVSSQTAASFQFRFAGEGEDGEQ